MNIILHAHASREFVRQVEDVFGANVVTIVDEMDDAGIAEALTTADVLLHVLRPVTAELIAGAPQLKLIQKIGVGVNTIDLEAAKARGIAVCNMPGTNTQAVVEHALGLVLAVLRRTITFNRLTKAGDGWDADPDISDSAGEICGRTVGLVGMGNVAKTLARVLAALGAKVIYTDLNSHPDLPHEFVSMQALLERADIVSLHIPLTPKTERIINAAALARMPRGAILINTARGGLVDEAALTQALASGRMRGAGLDVFADEPVDPANPLLKLETVVATPHIAWLTPETLNRSLKVAAENVRRLDAGGDLLHQVV